MVVGRQIVFQGGEEFRAQMEVREVYQRQMGVGVNGSQHKGGDSNAGRHYLAARGFPKIPKGEEGQPCQHQQDNVFPETLGMGKVDSLSKTTAIHGRIKYPEGEGHEGEKAQQGCGGPGSELAQDAGDERHAQRGLQQRQGYTGRPGRREQRPQVEELEILCHLEPGTHGV